MILASDLEIEYLRTQRGDVVGTSNAEWLENYNNALLADYESMRSHLPGECHSVLDIGSGLGGIDVLLSRHYPGLNITLVDGEDDLPVVNFSHETHSNREVALSFQRRNEVERVSYAKYPTLLYARDLVVSTYAWCFHMHPMTHLNRVRSACHLRTVLIVDVRRDRNRWHEIILEQFVRVAVALQKTKFERWVMRPL